MACDEAMEVNRGNERGGSTWLSIMNTRCGNGIDAIQNILL